jgi:serine/threonine protein phosphatase PrpC
MKAFKQSSKRPVSIYHYAISEKGRRSNNEDFLQIKEFSCQGVPIKIYALADGMGGHQGGEIASRTAVDIFMAYMHENSYLLLQEEKLREAINSAYILANKRLRQLEEANAEIDGLGTTLTAIVMVGERYWICHLGDTRAYRIEIENIEALTRDHSASAESVRQGLMSENDAARSPYSHALIRYIGSTEKFTPDIFPENGSFRIEPGVVLLLCCDGIFQSVSDLDIYEQVSRTQTLKSAANNLVSLAFANGSKDNLSVLLIESGILERKKPASPLMKFPFKKSGKKIRLFVILFILLLLCEIFLFKFLRNSLGGKDQMKKVRNEELSQVKNENKNTSKKK